jgi:hypothetical protein
MYFSLSFCGFTKDQTLWPSISVFFSKHTVELRIVVLSRRKMGQIPQNKKHHTHISTNTTTHSHSHTTHYNDQGRGKKPYNHEPGPT